jgi:hypothetical protein
VCQLVPVINYYRHQRMVSTLKLICKKQTLFGNNKGFLRNFASNILRTHALLGVFRAPNLLKIN